MNRLKELRIEKQLLQSDIAKIIGKSTRLVGFYETGERDMGTDTLIILADFFNTSIDYILGKDENTNINEKQVLLKLFPELSEYIEQLTSEELKYAIKAYKDTKNDIENMNKKEKE